MMGLLFKLPELPDTRQKGNNVASSACKINRRSVRQCIKHSTITGVDLKACAINVITELHLHPTSFRAAYEQICQLEQQGEIVLEDAMLRITTNQELESIMHERTKKVERKKRKKQRDLTKQRGGYRSNPVFTSMPLPASLA